MNRKSSISCQASDISQGPLVAVVGPTASGKSALALSLAKAFEGEIVAADSWTVRQELEIGTAKPTEQERAAVPHHMLDVVPPCADYTAVLFQRQAQAAITDITSRGKVPILVGGTGLYIDSVLYDYTFSPPGPIEERQRLNELSIADLLAEAAKRQLDTSQIDVRNKRRIIRLIETNGYRPSKQPLRAQTCILGLRISKEVLHERIAARVDQMLTAGLEREVLHLSQKYSWDCEGLKGIGYIEWQDYFVGKKTLEQTRQQIITNTKHLAKRQQTWFKRNADIVWIDDITAAKQQLYTFLKEH